MCSAVAPCWNLDNSSSIRFHKVLGEGTGLGGGGGVQKREVAELKGEMYSEVSEVRLTLLFNIMG